MIGAIPSLDGVSAAIRAKSALVQQLRSTPPGCWNAAVGQFVTELKASGLRDRVALITLMTDLMHELPNVDARDSTAAPGGAKAPPLHVVADTYDNVAAATNGAAADPIALCEHRLAEWLAASTWHEAPAAIHVRQMKLFLELHYTEPITLERLSVVVGREKGYLATLFRKRVGCPVREYLMRVRMRRATELIQQGFKIEAAMLSVGYRGKRNFYQQFVRTTGQRPGTYRPRPSGHHEDIP